MALKPQKQSVEPTQPENQTTPAPLSTNVDIESIIADELLDSVDWQQVRASLIKKAKAKFIAWLTSGNHSTPINLSPFPELAALPSRDDEGKAA